MTTYFHIISSYIRSEDNSYLSYNKLNSIVLGHS